MCHSDSVAPHRLTTLHESHFLHSRPRSVNSTFITSLEMKTPRPWGLYVLISPEHPLPSSSLLLGPAPESHSAPCSLCPQPSASYHLPTSYTPSTSYSGYLLYSTEAIPNIICYKIFWFWSFCVLFCFLFWYWVFYIWATPPALFYLLFWNKVSLSCRGPY